MSVTPRRIRWRSPSSRCTFGSVVGSHARSDSRIIIRSVGVVGQDPCQQVKCGRCRPVEVVDDEDHRLDVAQGAQCGADGVLEPPTLPLEVDGPGGGFDARAVGEAREQSAQLGGRGAEEGVELAVRAVRHQVFESLHERLIGGGRALVAPPVEDETRVLRRRPGQLAEQGRLPDPGVAREDHELHRTRRHPVPDPEKRPELGFPPHELDAVIGEVERPGDRGHRHAAGADIHRQGRQLRRTGGDLHLDRRSEFHLDPLTHGRRGLGHQHVPPLGRGTQSGGLVHVDPEHVVLGHTDLAGGDPHTEVDPMLGPAVPARQALLDVDARARRRRSGPGRWPARRPRCP